MSVAVKKVNGVEKVDVSLNQGKAGIKFKPESTAKYDDVRSGIEKNGFVVRDAQVTVRGRLQKSAAGLQFVVTNSGETFNVSSPGPELARALEARVGQETVLAATVPTPEKNKKQEQLIVRSIQSAENQ